jgi:N-acyl-phosphatidylethanolamine-hydrolysing phospholipase D
MKRRWFRRRTVHLVAAVFVTLAALVVADLVSVSESVPASDRPGHHLARGFRNVNPSYSYSVGQRLRHVVARGRAPHRGEPLEVLANDGAPLKKPRTPASITWVGHSTFLVQVAGVNVLTDPHFGDRTSPVQFAGPRRLVPPGVRFEDLPDIHAVVISHDHYDHLDAGTVLRLAREHRPRFFVPLGIKAWLADLGIDDVVEMDWWQAATYRGITFTCTPAQHSSGRSITLADQSLRLWSSWVIAGGDKSFFFAGDTGYYAGLAEIGRRLGPFDLAAVPIGGYSDYRVHHPNHLNPEEAVQAFEDVRADVMVPMHWGTFELNREPFQEPPGRVMSEALRRGLEERIALMSPGQTIAW